MGGGLRAVIEGICNDKKVKSGMVEKKKSDGSKKLVRSDKLDGKIEGLYQNGYLTENNAKVLHNLRFIGNEALHELSTPNPKELSIAIDIVEHILENIYEIGTKASEVDSTI